MKKEEKGFLLIGLLILVAIIGYFYFSNTEKGKSRIEQSKEQGQTAIDQAKAVKEKLESRNREQLNQ